MFRLGFKGQKISKANYGVLNSSKKQPKNHYPEYFLRGVGRSENLGVPVLLGGHNLSPLVEIG